MAVRFQNFQNNNIFRDKSMFTCPDKELVLVARMTNA
jgi:hypothetical protein